MAPSLPLLSNLFRLDAENILDCSLEIYLTMPCLWGTRASARYRLRCNKEKLKLAGAEEICCARGVLPRGIVLVRQILCGTNIIVVSAAIGLSNANYERRETAVSRCNNRSIIRACYVNY